MLSPQGQVQWKMRTPGAMSSVQGVVPPEVSKLEQRHCEPAISEVYL